MSLNKLLLAEITKNLQKATKFKRPKNQWQDPGEITEVNSRNITMRGVNYPVLGVGADGYTQMMQPEMDYQFPEGPVVEYPMIQYNNILDSKTMYDSKKQGGEMIRRADGSYSRRGLWDNIRANKGSGKKPTKQMLEQERKIKAQEKQFGGQLLNDLDMYNYYNPMMDYMARGGEPQNAGFQALPDYVQNKIMANMAYGGYIPEMMHGGYYMEEGGEPDGGMAIGQIEASIDKLMNLRKFIQPDSDLEPWISSKLTLMDHYTDAVNDYMQYNPEAQEGEEYEEDEMMMMAQGGGIPQRYKNMGFNKVGVKKKSTRPGKKWMVLAKKGSQYKVVHGGYKGMQDFTQHRNEGRRKNFWNRMGGKGSSKATDPFSPLYWHKRFGTWEEGGQVDDVFANGGYVGYDGKRHMSNTPTWSGNVGYQTGGSISDEERAFEEQMMRDAEAYNVPAPQIRIPAEFQETAAPAVKKVVRNTGSIVDYLASKGKASDYNSRAKLAASMGIKNYRGTADQNMALVQMLSNSSPTSITDTTVDNNEPIWTDKSYMPEIVVKGKRKSSSIFNNPNVKFYSGPFPEQAEVRSSSTQLKGTSSKLDPYGSSLIRRDEPLVDDELQAEFRNQLLLNAGILPQIGLPIGPGLKAGATLAFNALRPAIIAGAIRMSPLVGKAAQIAPKVIRAKAATNIPKNAVNWADKLTPPLQRSLERVRWGNLSMADKLAAAKKGASAFKKDGGIYINPANKGKFTASAQRAGMGVQEFAQHVMANREDYSPTQVKRANFARNAAKWNKQQGGPVVGDEMDVTPAQLEYLRQMGYEFEMI